MCEGSVLSNEIEWKDSEILKNISFYLGYDVKEELAHISMEKPCSRNMRYDDICKKIDKLMSDKYKQTSNHQDSNYKNAAKLLLDYFDDIGEKEAKKNFDYTFSIKEKIAYNVIYNEKTRKSFAELEKLIDINNFSYLLKESKTKNIIKKLINDEKACQFFAEIEERYDRESLSILMKSPKEIKEYIEFEKKFGKDTISTLLNNSNIRKNVISLINNEKICADLCKYDISDINKLFGNPNIIKSIINGELSDSNYKDLHGSSYSKPIEINNGTNSISVAFNSEISQNEYTLNFFKSAFAPIIKYVDDFDFTSSINFNNPINRRTGITGEAYIYELLKNSGKFKNVKWNMLSETGKGENFEYKGKNYKIDWDYSHYDILVETYDGRNLYIEVKSTRHEYENNNKIPFFISHKQIEAMEKTQYPNEYILAIVFNAMYNPNHFFMTLRKNI